MYVYVYIYIEYTLKPQVGVSFRPIPSTSNLEPQPSILNPSPSTLNPQPQTSTPNPVLHLKSDPQPQTPDTRP